jgi:6-phosphofructokinase 1
MDEEDLAHLKGVERDAHGHVRIAEVPFGDILKEQVQRRLSTLGVKMTLQTTNIGYELRCADPIPFDMEYARDLGYCAAKYVVEGGSAAMVSMQNSRFVPVPFDSIMDRKTGRTRVRMVDIESDRYMIARRYMVRLRRDDFEDAHLLAELANVVKLPIEGFEREFRSLVEHEPVPRVFFPEDEDRYARTAPAPSVRPKS